MRDLTRREAVGLMVVLTVVTLMVGWTCLHGVQSAASTGITLRETFAQPPAAAPVLSPSANAPAAAISPPDALLAVHVAGAVKKPGLYRLPPGSRNDDALKAAGGPVATANTDAINLAARVEDGTQLYVPTRQEQPEGPAPATSETLSTATSHTSASSAAHSTGAGKPARRGGKSNKLTDPSQGKINLNTASADQLQRIPGVGPAMAQRILEFRQENHGFKSEDDLLQISGIGDKKFEKMRPFVTVGSGAASAHASSERKHSP